MAGVEGQSQAVFALQYAGTEKATGKGILIKRMRLIQVGGIPANALREVYFLKLLKSQFVSELLDIVLAPASLYLVVQDHGRPLLDLLTDQPDAFTLTYRRKVAFNLCKCVSFLETQGILHLGLSPEVITVDDDKNVRIEGFYNAQQGNSVRIPSNKRQFSVYMSPELMASDSPVSPVSDMWSVALVLLSMIAKQPFHIQGSRSDISAFIDAYLHPQGDRDVVQKLRQVAPEATQLEIDLIQRLVRENPMERLNAKQTMKHEYFAGLDGEEIEE